MSLFPEEDLIIPLIQGFESILSSKYLNQSIQPENVKLIVQTLSFFYNYIKNNEELYTRNVEELFKRKIAFFLPNIRALVLFYLKFKLKKDDTNDNRHDFFHDGFNDIMENYLNIFPEIKDIKITRETISKDESLIFCEIQDADSEEWIPQDRMSSGMFRTLMYIIEIMTAPEGSVILIDEFENSLGINCMSEITDFILDHADGLQFIITSHHPYIINNIPWQDWQIVSRKGSHITTKKATEISALDTASSLDKFTQLINVLDSEDIAA